MALTPGTRLGVYDVIAQIGKGGMGQVYRARDTKLNRDVALKVLPDSFAYDSHLLARFTREARTLASLNHPHIAQIYGLDESGGVRALVMELVEGEDLSRRIARGAIPSGEALAIAKQIAEALEAAHEQGIIHRDLKPANIKVRADGTVKVLDFGLAKAIAPIAASPAADDLANSPTITTPAMTEDGMILGTAAYMSPEQARGNTVDKRTDIWAFGAVLFEMLTGAKPFVGDGVADVLSRVLQREPDLTMLPRATPPRIRMLVARCLVKDPHQRLHDMGDVRLALDGAFETGAPLTASAASLTAHGRRPWVALTGVAVLGMIAMAIPTMRHLRETPAAAPPETRVDIVTPATDDPTSFALSPDGRQIVFVASGDGVSRLWLRSLASTTAQPLAGTEGAALPFWSPDGRSVAFFAGAALRRLDLGGGAPQTLAPAINGTGGTWNADDVIVFAPSRTTPLMRVAATGGAMTSVTTLGPHQQGHMAPHFLADGRRLLFYVFGGPDATGIYLGALDGSAPARLTSADSAGVFLPEGPGSAAALRGSGWLLWVRGETLTARRLDAAKAVLTGEPITLAEGVAISSVPRGAIAVAATGLVAYRTGGGSRRQLTWLDRSGTTRGTAGDMDDNDLRDPRVSPDGRRVVVSRLVQGNQDLWILDGSRTSRFTFDPARDYFPVWSPDGKRIAFRSNRTGFGDIYQRFTSGAGEDERLVTSEPGKTPTSWSADGRFLLYHSIDPQTADGDLWVVPMSGADPSSTGSSRSVNEGDRAPWALLKTSFNERGGEFSPDGRWVAYRSNESGRTEIYVRPFVPPGAATPADGRWQVSTTGGIHAVWRSDGKELFYLNPAGAMMAAPISVTGSTLEVGAPVELFPTHIYGGGVDAQQGRQYDVTRDGRFLINTVLDSAAAPITLLMNWNPESKK